MDVTVKFFLCFDNVFQNYGRDFATVAIFG